MSRLHPTRLKLSRLSFVFFGLAFSVFIWGLGYKLSLYDPPKAVSHNIPEAKILSKDEQAVIADGVTIADTEVPAELVLSFGVFFLLLPDSGPLTSADRHAEQDHEQLWSLDCPASMNAFFFRPPPALA
jgi:hypothetical protein